MKRGLLCFVLFFCFLPQAFADEVLKISAIKKTTDYDIGTLCIGLGINLAASDRI